MKGSFSLGPAGSSAAVVVPKWLTDFGDACRMCERSGGHVYLRGGGVSGTFYNLIYNQEIFGEEAFPVVVLH